MKSRPTAKKSRKREKQQKVPKFFYLFASDYTLLGSMFFFVAFSMSGASAFFGSKHLVGFGIILWIIALVSLLIFVRRLQILRYLFLDGVYVTAMVRNVYIVSMNFSACDCRIDYSYSFHGDEYSSHALLTLGRSEISAYKNKRISVLIHPKRPKLTYVQDSLTRVVFFSALFRSLFPLKSKKHGYNEVDKGSDAPGESDENG